LDPINGSLSCQQVRFDDCGAAFQPISEEIDRWPLPRSFPVVAIVSTEVGG
jgi:hypothetical protein